jgi:DNA end-binding protein Ku
MLHTMYYENEVRRLEEFAPPDVELKDGEVKVAHQLIKALEGEFDPSKYHDTFEENVKELIKARIEGDEVTAVEKPHKPAPVADLMAALKESLAQTEGKKKAAQRVQDAEEASRIHVVSGKKTPGKKKRTA